MNIANTKVFNFEGALRGMRNPLNSWEKSDSTYDDYNNYIIGPKDLDLAQRLIRGGPEHRKFLRQILVSVDITAPLYWWKEFDTYKIGTTANSTSTMHKLTSSPITLKCFETDDISLGAIEEIETGSPNDFVTNLIYALEDLRQKYLETKDKKYWKELVRWLPNGWLQTRTWTANYEVLLNIYHQRQNHKLSEWREFCKWIETLPYFEELINTNIED